MPTRRQRREASNTRRIYSMDESCDQLGIGRSKLYDLIRTGKLHPVRLGTSDDPAGGRQVFTAAELDRFVDSLSAAS